MHHEALAPEEVRAFVVDGFVRLAEAFPPEVAAACRAWLWSEIAVDPDDRSTWTAPVIRHPGSAAEPFRAASDTPRLHAAFDQLVGPGRWRPKGGLGTFPIRFPSEVDPGDAGWHVDASFERDGSWWVDGRSTGRALLLLYLLSDVGPDDAPTRVLAGSHRDIARLLVAAGEAGMPWASVPVLHPDVQAHPVVPATGRAGDVYLCHPFLVHAASWPHRGRQPRFIAQPGLDPVGEVIRGPDAPGPRSPVELAVTRG